MLIKNTEEKKNKAESRFIVDKTTNGSHSVIPIAGSKLPSDRLILSEIPPPIR